MKDFTLLSPFLGLSTYTYVLNILMQFRGFNLELGSESSKCLQWISTLNFFSVSNHTEGDEY